MNMVLIINCGSSSLKYQLIDMDIEEAVVKGVIERIGLNDSKIKHSIKDKDDIKIDKALKDHKEAINLMVKLLTNKDYGVIKSISDIKVIGHRVVHGGEKYKNSVLITDEVKKDIKEFSKLAPLHNPANLLGIEVCEEVFTDSKNIAVFDTAFHQSIPEKAYLYGLPYEFYDKFGVRKYGFHGMSHMYVSQKLSEVLNKDLKDLKVIICHLGNGSSMCCIDKGKVIDTTMGFTPIDGLIMGTRCGNVDPSIIFYLIEQKGFSCKEINNILNKKSGVYGVSGVSSDFRDIEKEAEKGNKRAKLSLDLFYYRVKKEIGAYVAAMNGVDVIAFTAGVGENGIEGRKECLEGLNYLGVEIDDEKNKIRGKIGEISKDTSKVKVFVIPTNEELIIARESVRVV